MKRNLSEAPFFSALVKYTERRADSWHCPGHSGGAAFLKAPVGERFREFFGENLLRADICNAVEEMGQLLDHTGAAAEAEQNAAEIFGADHLFFVTNGTSTSNKIVWHSQVGPDDIVVVDRNCHKSVLHAIMMTGATPIYLTPTRNHHGLIGPIPAAEFSLDAIRAKIEAHPFIKDRAKKPRILTLTQSTYDGVLYRTDAIKRRLDGRVDVLHFDEAWLPHATFHPVYEGMHAITGKRTRKSLVFATQSTHKTLAGLSQASQILVKEPESRKLNRTLFNEAYLMHTSTSPQYSIIASCDVAAAMMADGAGEKIVDGALTESYAFRSEMRRRQEADSDTDASWGFSVWGPAHSAEKLASGALTQDDWLLKPGEAWHGFGELESGFNMLDPLKCTVMTPGLDMNGVFAREGGMPASVVAKFLCENGVIVEKYGLYSFFIMFTIGITKGRWSTLVQALEKFNRDFAANALVGDVMPSFTAAHPSYAAVGLRDLCSEIHEMYRAHDIARMTTEMYTSPMVPVMKPSAAFAKMAHEEIDRVAIDQLEGRVTAVLLTPYPPGIPLLVPGERINAFVVAYLKFARAFSEKFPGFETDVHGLVRTAPAAAGGQRDYFVDCIRAPKGASPRAGTRRVRKSAIA